MKILVVEDDPMILKIIQFKLKKEGYEIIIAEDGKQALKVIEESKLDLIISDVMMPYVSGLELVEKVKTSVNPIPMLLLSSVGQEDMITKAFSLGVDDYMKKPFSPNELSVRVKKLLA